MSEVPEKVPARYQHWAVNRGSWEEGSYWIVLSETDPGDFRPGAGAESGVKCGPRFFGFWPAAWRNIVWDKGS